ncbi:MAG: type II toxin-antitoxin system VapC family toxin [Verrucomicrobiota bacterium]
MNCLVDTNVISDVNYQDPNWFDWSSEKMGTHHCLINPIIYSELAYRAESFTSVDEILTRYELTYTELPRKALFLAAQAFKTYRKKGGTKTAPLPDFFIGAHAQASALPLITRDTARYQTYFPDVALICPD